MAGAFIEKPAKWTDLPKRVHVSHSCLLKQMHSLLFLLLVYLFMQA